MADTVLNFSGRVAVVTGAGGGLGREYALLLASRKASVVVNDLGGTRNGEGQNTNTADLVVNEIIKNGGKAVANYDSVENGENIIKTAINHFGRIDIVINNAGILRDKSFLKLTEHDWDLVHKVHLKGAFSVTKAAWPYFRKQKYGRIIMTCSNSGLFGNFGQANYSSAKLGLLGLCNTLAIEGYKYNIYSNTIIPVAASRLTEDILPYEVLDKFKAKYVAPLVVWLCHENNQANGLCLETAGGWVGKYRLLRSKGKLFHPPESISPESIRDKWFEIIDDTKYTLPLNIHDQMTELLINDSCPKSISTTLPINTKISINDKFMNDNLSKFKYESKDVILYALGIGFSTKQSDYLNFIYENSDNFKVFPTFGILPSVKAFLDNDIFKQVEDQYFIKINPFKLLHGEHYFEVLNEIPVQCEIFTDTKLIEVLDKGTGALIITESITVNKNKENLFYNQTQLFVVDAGNFGGNKKPTSSVKIIVSKPNRSCDAFFTEKISYNQAALYRLSGDSNPLHIDPNFSLLGGYDKPILHGLCTLGFSVRHVLKEYANNDTRLFKRVKARFANTIIPGQTLKTEMWQENNRIHFESSVLETDKKVIVGAYIDLIKIFRKIDNLGLDNNKL